MEEEFDGNERPEQVDTGEFFHGSQAFSFWKWNSVRGVKILILGMVTEKICWQEASGLVSAI
jgi:hypothetical protein